MTFFLLPLLALAALAVSAAMDRGRSRRAVGAAARAGLNLLPSLLGLTAGVALSLAALPPRAVAQLFQSHGAAGFFLLAGVGALLTIPAPVAYPLAGSLRLMGATLPALASFVCTLTMVGVLTAPLEVRAFGRRFTALRQSLCLALALAVGAAMGALL